MILRLPSGLKISVPPVFFWESRRADLMIRSGSAFYPYHVTSRLCLELLDQHLASGRCKSLVDVGCGSGILALLAASLEVPFVLGFDIDLRAVAVSRANAARNNLMARVQWMAGTAAAVCSRFDCVVANLPYGVILKGADDLGRLLEPGGFLLLSGFHDIHFHEIREKLLSSHIGIEKITSGDHSFYGAPPSGSFTWMAVLARKTC